MTGSCYRGGAVVYGGLSESCYRLCCLRQRPPDWRSVLALSAVLPGEHPAVVFQCRADSLLERCQLSARTGHFGLRVAATGKGVLADLRHHACQRGADQVGGLRHLNQWLGVAMAAEVCSINGAEATFALTKHCFAGAVDRAGAFSVLVGVIQHMARIVEFAPVHVADDAAGVLFQLVI